MKKLSNLSEKNEKNELKLPKISQKMGFPREKARSFHDFSGKKPENPINGFAEEIREKSPENRLGKSKISQIRKRNFEGFSMRFEDFYLKRERKFLNNYNNKFIRAISHMFLRKSLRSILKMKKIMKKR